MPRGAVSDEPVRVHDFLPWAVKPPKAAGYWLEPVTCGVMTQNLGDTLVNPFTRLRAAIIGRERAAAAGSRCRQSPPRCAAPELGHIEAFDALQI